MTIWRLDIGLCRYPDGRLAYEVFEYLKGICGCHIVTIGCVCFTWMSDECLYPDKNN